MLVFRRINGQACPTGGRSKTGRFARQEKIHSSLHPESNPRQLVVYSHHDHVEVGLEQQAQTAASPLPPPHPVGGLGGLGLGKRPEIPAAELPKKVPGHGARDESHLGRR